MSSALQGRFLTTRPPGKFLVTFKDEYYIHLENNNVNLLSTSYVSGIVLSTLYKTISLGSYYSPHFADEETDLG